MFKNTFTDNETNKNYERLQEHNPYIYNILITDIIVESNLRTIL